MSRADERLQRQAAQAQAAIDAGLRQKQLVARKQHALAAKARDKRRVQMGTLAEAHGLGALDDATLAGLFAALGPLLALPNPVAVLEGLLSPEEVSV